MKITPVDPDAFRADMLRIMASMREDALRWRFEIEAEGRHIGLASSCYLDENDRSIPWEAIDQDKMQKKPTPSGRWASRSVSERPGARAWAPKR